MFLGFELSLDRFQLFVDSHCAKVVPEISVVRKDDLTCMERRVHDNRKRDAALWAGEQASAPEKSIEAPMEMRTL